MDIAVLKKKIAEGISKYRYVILIVIVGIFLMLLPVKKTEEENSTTANTVIEKTEDDITQQLCSILNQIQGVGRVEVMLTVDCGPSTVYQYDEKTTGGETGSIQHDTVIVTDSDRGQSALIQQVNPPTYRGAIIVCQGADSASVRLYVIEAVARVTGLGADRICVLKMK